MISWLIHRTVPDASDPSNPRVRYAVGRICGYIGICLNILLFASKYLVGFLVGSVSIKADAINNLTDAVSNIASILSFHWAEKPADREHPYGHERTETITALFMGVLILYLGIEMVSQSIDKILHNSAPDFQWSSVLVLYMSIAVKLLMYSYNHKYARIYHSDLLEANAIDSRNDIMGTTLVLVSTLISPLIHYDLDGVTGLVVSGIIFWSAYGLMKDVINRLLGEAPDPKVLNELTDLILLDPDVLDVHDVVLHAYGPQKVYATAHAVVDGTSDLISIHNGIDTIERRVQHEMNIELVVHIDPIIPEDHRTNRYRSLFEKALEEICPEWMMHDFRIQQRSPSWVDCYFDLVVPYEEKRSQEEIEELIQKKLPEKTHFNLYVRMEHPYS